MTASSLSRSAVLLLVLAHSVAAASPVLEEAIRSCDLNAARKAIRSSPGSSKAETEWNRARLALLAGNTPEAIERLEWLVETRARSSEVRLWFSRALFARASEVSALRRPFVARRAVAELERSLQLDPLNDDAAIDMTLIHLRVPLLGDGTAAAEELAARLTTRRSPVASLARGIIAYENERWRLAETELSRAASTLEDPRRALFWLGYVYQRLGRWDDAWETHEMLLERSPNDPRVWYELARTAQFSGLHTERGEEMLQRYLRTELPSGARSKDEARALLRTLQRKR